jgi:ABC-type dipeptide/oligopeptide/nickel transport system permease component
MGVIGRMVRSTVLEILSQEFPTALRAKGCQRRWKTRPHGGGIGGQFSAVFLS